MTGHLVVELLRQRVQGRQRRHCGHHFGGKQPYQCRHNARELRVALAEVTGPVQVVEEEARCSGVARMAQKVGVGVRETCLLVAFDLRHPLCKARVRQSRLPFRLHRGQVMQDCFAVLVHLGLSGLWLVSGP